MPINLVRIDDRLVHGQVTVGWGGFLNPDTILLVSDEIAQDEWQKELYSSCTPFHVTIAILDVTSAADAILKDEFENNRVILLVETPAALVELCRKGVVLKQVNIGGMHHKPDKKKLLSYVYVDENDLSDLNFLLENDIELVCQELPQSKKDNLPDLLNKI